MPLLPRIIKITIYAFKNCPFSSPPKKKDSSILIFQARKVRITRSCAGAERAVIIGVGLSVRDRIEFVERLTPALLEYANHQFVLGRVVAFRLREWDAVFRVIGQAHSEAVGLYPMIAIAIFAGRIG